MATSTYSESVSAQLVTDWTMVSLTAGHQYRGDPDNTNDNQRRKHNVVQRYRHMQALTSFSSQEGQVGVGNDLTVYMGQNASIGPQGSLGYICTDDVVDLHQQGTDIVKQEQTWEHFGAWESFDVADLAS